MEKRALALSDLDAETAMELPDRETLALINIVIFDVVDIRNVDVAAAVCANVGVLQQGNVRIDCNATA